jgi:hypothetical protein
LPVLRVSEQQAVALVHQWEALRARGFLPPKR